MMFALPFCKMLLVVRGTMSESSISAATAKLRPVEIYRFPCSQDRMEEENEKYLQK